MPFSVTYTFVPFTTIFSGEVNTNFTNLVNSGNTHEVAVTGIHGVGSGDIVGTTLTQTLTNKTLVSPTFSGPITFTGAVTFSAGITLPTTQRVNLNVGGTSYIAESAANQISLYTGSTERLRLNNASSYTEVRTGSFIIQPASNFYLDGGGDTYLFEQAANVITVVAGGTTSSQFIASGFAVPSTQRVYLDGGSDTYLFEQAANVITVVNGGSTSAQFITTGLAVPSTLNVYLDGGGDTYLTESAANQISLYTGGTERLRLNNGSNYTEIRSGSLIIQSGANFFLDGGTNDYWTNSANGQNDLYAAGSLVLRTASSGPIQFFNGINLTNPVTPAANIIYSLSGARCLLSFDMNTATTLSQFNITTATRTALGQVTITWNTDFASATDYVVLATAQDAGGANHICTITQKTTFGAIILVRDNAGALVDSIVNVVAFGLQ